MRIVSILLLLVACAAAEPVALEKPVRVEVYIKPADPKARPEKLIGDLLQYDDDTATIQLKSGESRTLKWIELTPASAFDARKAATNQKDARQLLELGRFGWAIGAESRARGALASAVKLDASLKGEVEGILKSPSGEMLKPAPATEPATNEPELENLPPAQQAKRKPGEKLVKYQKSTPDDDAKAIEGARKVAKEVESKLKLSFQEIQTDHFIIFTDWDKREYGFLKDNLEAAYALVSKQFDIPTKENVFVGKLPVFMLASHDSFKSFASNIDHFAPGNNVAGYYASYGDSGIGHMAMWKPDVNGNNVHEAETRWAYVLTHEFTHAFVARYRSNQEIPRWLNEGLAEVIANSKFPRAGALDFARRMSLQVNDFSGLFNDDQMPGGEMYPVMMTMVQMLISYDRHAFIEYFNDLKAGDAPEAALKKRFNIDYKQLIGGWKKYMTTGKVR